MSKGVLVDVTKCIGCRSCQVSCKSWNNLPAESGTFSNDWDSPGKQSMPCNEPAGESPCITPSFAKTKERTANYKPAAANKDCCFDCRYCMLACPFVVPDFQGDKAFPYVLKCRFCCNHIIEEDDLEPAYVTACPTGALKYGETKELLTEAWDRINKNSYYVKQVYGEKDRSGTSWLYISNVSFDMIDFPTEAFGSPVTQDKQDISIAVMKLKGFKEK